ncbi:MAG: condensation domain-containing protein, partial [Myxococcota bacterium]
AELDERGTFVLTPIQSWFIDQDFATPAHYNQSVLIEISPSLRSEWLSRAMAAVINHHGALRMRIRPVDGVMMQTIMPPQALVGEDGSDQHLCSEIDVSSASETLDTACERVCAEQQSALDLAAGRLTRLCRIHTGQERDRLLIIVHHMAVDGLSWYVILEDLRAVYYQIAEGDEATLPPPSSSIRSWERHLRASQPLAERERGFWHEQTTRPSGVLQQPATAAPCTYDQAGRVSFTLDPELTRTLLRRATVPHRCNVEDLLATSLLRVLAAYTGARQWRIAQERHGRENLASTLDLSRTVGWFTALFPVHLSLGARSDLDQEIRSVKEGYRAVPRGGIGYGILRYLMADQALSSEPEILLNYLGQFDHLFDGDFYMAVAREPRGIDYGPLNRVSVPIEINAAVHGDCLQVDWIYDRNRYQAGLLDALCADMQRELTGIIEHCVAVHGSWLSPSDVPAARLDLSSLDRFLQRFDAATRAEVQDVCELTPMQEGMLFHSIHDPEGSYFERFTCRIQGLDDPERLRRAWQLTLDRYGILRTSFHWTSLEKPLQVVHARAPLPWRQLDWREHSDPRRDLQDLLDQDQQRGFDLGAAPLMQCTLARISDDGWLLGWTHHHILMDGWCVPQVLLGVLDSYERDEPGSATRGQSWARSDFGFRDYVLWLQGRDQQAARSFWSEYLADFRSPTPVGIAPDRPLSGRYADADLHLAAATTETLDALAREYRVTLGVILQGAWAICLSRLARQSDVVFGMTSVVRPDEIIDIDNMVGLFINTLPVRLQVAENA